MKYPQLVHMPRDVEHWLEKQLEARGISGIICAKYILSLFPQVNTSLPTERFSCNSHSYDKYRNKKCFQAYCDRQSWDVDSLVVHYLMSTLKEKCDIEKLVDDLCVKLKEIENNATCFLDASANFENKFPRPDIPVTYSDGFVSRNLINPEEAQPLPSCDPIWTRGLLHDSEPVKDQNKMEDYFSSLFYENPSDNFGFEFTRFKSDERQDGKERDRIHFYNKQNLLASEGTERLYERNTDFDKLIAKFDANIEGIWKPSYENEEDLGNFKYETIFTNPPIQSGSSLIWSFDQNGNDFVSDERNGRENIEHYKPNFPGWSKLPTPVLASNFGMSATLNLALQKWSSVDGQSDENNVLLNHKRDESGFTEVIPKSHYFVQSRSLRAIHHDRHKGKGDDEDLLTSAKTHFRPICMEEMQANQPVTYADGTTFAISNEFEKVTFTRSNSGILYLDTDSELETPRKYMVYKESAKLFDSESDLSLMEEFVPKFRVRQSNEKCCQTEDVVEDDQIVPSFNETDCDSDSYECEEDDEFFFPGDSELAENISDKMDDEGKMELRRMKSDCNYNDIYVTDNAEFLEKMNECVCGGGNAWLPLSEYDMRQEWSDIWCQESGDEGCGCIGVGLPTKEEYFRFREELTQEGEQLLSDLSCLQQLYSNSKWGDDESGTVSDFNEEENASEAFCSSEFLNKFKGSTDDAGWKTWFGRGEMSKSTSDENVTQMNKLLEATDQNLNSKLNEVREGAFITEKSQNDKKRRNSEREKVCNLCSDGQSQCTHYRFSFCDPTNPHLNRDASRLRGDSHELFKSLKRPLSF